MNYNPIAKELLHMRDADLAKRNELLQRGELNEGYHPEMEAVHLQHAERVTEIFKAIGYPTADKIGQDASDAAWLIIQHAISKPAFMKHSLALLEEACQEGTGDPLQFAYLYDRIAVFSETEQHFGTQFDWDEFGQLSPQPYGNIDLVNLRRERLGLVPLDEQTKQIRQQAKQEGQQPPRNWQVRQEEFKHWKKKVGWIS